MRIAEMFVKPIDRDIKGVIKVGQDDDVNIYQELDEYVVTKELLKHFRSFLKAIKTASLAIPIKWGSGFPVSLVPVSPTFSKFYLIC